MSASKYHSTIKYYLALKIMLLLFTPSKAQIIDSVMIDRMDKENHILFDSLNTAIYHYVELLALKLNKKFTKVVMYELEISSNYFDVKALRFRMGEFQTALEAKANRWHFYNPRQFDELINNNPKIEDINKKLEINQYNLKNTEEVHDNGEMDPVIYTKRKSHLQGKRSTSEKKKENVMMRSKEMENTALLYIVVSDYNYSYEGPMQVGIRIEVMDNKMNSVKSIAGKSLTKTLIINHPTMLKPDAEKLYRINPMELNEKSSNKKNDKN